MPQQGGGFDFSGLARASRPQGAAAPVEGFDFGGIDQAQPRDPETLSDRERLVLGLPPKDTRSTFGRAVDVATTPLVSDEAARKVSARMTGRRGGDALAPVTGGAFDAYSPTALLETARAFLSQPVTTARAMAGGLVEGAAQYLDGTPGSRVGRHSDRWPGAPSGDCGGAESDG